MLVRFPLARPVRQFQILISETAERVRWTVFCDGAPVAQGGGTVTVDEAISEIRDQISDLELPDLAPGGAMVHAGQGRRLLSALASARDAMAPTGLLQMAEEAGTDKEGDDA